MKKARLLVLGLAAALGLALAGSALAVQTMLVTEADGSLGATGDVTIAIAQDDADAPLAKVTIYVPVGYSLRPQTLGARIGSAQATVILKALAGAKAPVTGDIVNDDPAKYASNQSNLQCTGQATHTAVWLLNLSLAGNALPVPVYVDAVTGGPEAAFASLKLQVCFSSPDIPQSAGGAPSGAQPVSAAMSLTGVITNPSTAGTFAFRTLYTPYNPGTATVNAAATTEARSIAQLPAQLTLTGKKTRKVTGKGARRKVQTIVTVSGALTQGNVGVSGQTVTIAATGFARKSVTTGANGRYTATYRITKRTTFTAEAEIASKRDDAAGCAGTSLAPAGCKTATTAQLKAKAARSFAATPFRR